MSPQYKDLILSPLLNVVSNYRSKTYLLSKFEKYIKLFLKSFIIIVHKRKHC